MSLSLARLYAWEILESQRKRDAYVRDLFLSHHKLQSLSCSDRAFAYRLAIGVVATKGVLEEFLRLCAHKPSAIKASVRTALLISLFEICFLNKEAHAAIHQGVLLAAHANKHAKSFANACLRRALCVKDDFFAQEGLSYLEQKARKAGFPAWILERVADDYDENLALRYLHDVSQPAQVYLVSNELNCAREEFLDIAVKQSSGMKPYRLELPCKLSWITSDCNASIETSSLDRVVMDKGGCSYVPPSLCGALLEETRLLEDPQIKKLLKTYQVFVSDIAAQQVSLSVVEELVHKGSKSPKILEIGAGRGTKTVQIQNACMRVLGAQISYDTLDIHAFKEQLLRERMEGFGVHLEQSFIGDACRLDEVLPKDRRYDLIFIDAPCSGLGTLARHPEIIWSLSPQDISKLAETQLAMLKSAASYLDKQGSLVYSTCSLLREENEQVIEDFLASSEGRTLSLVLSRHTHIHEVPSDYHFVAVMRSEG